jgi:hypothetical protein
MKKSVCAKSPPEHCSSFLSAANGKSFAADFLAIFPIGAVAFFSSNERF